MILAVDPGLATFGWSIVTPRTGAVRACGVLIQKPNPKPSKHVDRVRRADVQAEQLEILIRRWKVHTIAIEEMSFAPRAQAAAKIGIGLSWGVVIGLCRAVGLARRVIPPKTWQRAIVPAAPGEKRTAAIDYAVVYRELRTYVDCDRLLADVCESSRSHALDASGIGIYAALVTETFDVKRKERSHG